MICLLLGFPMAYWLARTDSRHKNLLLMLVVLPLFAGNAVRAAGWMVVFGTKGAVNSLAGALGLVRQPLTIMYTEGAVIVGGVAINLPFMVLTLQSVIEGIDRSVEEAALGLAPDRWRCSVAPCSPWPCPACWPGRSCASSWP
jgi:putative spermidine/putrescine transport system permease protein